MSIYIKSSLIIIIGLFVAPTIVLADQWIIPQPRIAIPGINAKIFDKDFQPNCIKDTNDPEKEICTMPWLNEYIAGIYKYAIGVVAILATIVMMVGGLVWMTAGGNQGRIGEAKQWITGALTGLILTFCSYSILYFVNPDLVKLKPIKVERIKVMETTNYLCNWEYSTQKKCPPGTESTDGSKCDKSKLESTTLGEIPLCCCINNSSIGTSEMCQKSIANGEVSLDYTTVTEKLKLPPACDNFDFSNSYGIDPKILKALAATESSCNPSESNDVGACGLMQMMEGTANISCEELKSNPQKSIQLAAKYISENSSAHKYILENIYAGYNGGYGTNFGGPLATSKDCGGNISAYKCCINPGELTETQDHVLRSIKYYNSL